MQISKNDDGVVYVTLSRRNIEQLLAALDQGRTSVGICRRCEDGTNLYVHGEDNAVHYGARQAGPGLDRLLNEPRMLYPVKENV